MIIAPSPFLTPQERTISTLKRVDLDTLFSSVTNWSEHGTDTGVLSVVQNPYTATIDTSGGKNTGDYYAQPDSVPLNDELILHMQMTGSAFTSGRLGLGVDFQDVNNLIRIRLTFGSNQAVIEQIVSSVSSQLTTVDVTGISPDSPFIVRLQITSSTSFRLKIWAVAEAEPRAWTTVSGLTGVSNLQTFVLYHSKPSSGDYISAFTSMNIGSTKLDWGKNSVVQNGNGSHFALAGDKHFDVFRITGLNANGREAEIFENLPEGYFRRLVAPDELSNLNLETLGSHAIEHTQTSFSSSQIGSLPVSLHYRGGFLIAGYPDTEISDTQNTGLKRGLIVIFDGSYLTEMSTYPDDSSVVNEFIDDNIRIGELVRSIGGDYFLVGNGIILLDIYHSGSWIKNLAEFHKPFETQPDYPSSHTTAPKLDDFVSRLFTGDSITFSNLAVLITVDKYVSGNDLDTRMFIYLLDTDTDNVEFRMWVRGSGKHDGDRVAFLPDAPSGKVQFVSFQREATGSIFTAGENSWLNIWQTDRTKLLDFNATPDEFTRIQRIFLGRTGVLRHLQVTSGKIIITTGFETTRVLLRRTNSDPYVSFLGFRRKDNWNSSMLTGKSLLNFLEGQTVTTMPRNVRLNDNW